MSNSDSMSNPVSAQSDERLAITDGAVRQISSILAAADNERMKLRITVSGGGCSGFQYGFSIDDAVTEEDVLFERGNVSVVVDEMSLDLLAGSVVDYVDELIGSSFQIRNPNATSACGCGASFAI